MLRFEGLVVGGDPCIPDDRHAVSVAELGVLTTGDAPGFGRLQRRLPLGGCCSRLSQLVSLHSLGFATPPRVIGQNPDVSERGHLLIADQGPRAPQVLPSAVHLAVAADEKEGSLSECRPR